MTLLLLPSSGPETNMQRLYDQKKTKNKLLPEHLVKLAILENSLTKVKKPDADIVPKSTTVSLQVSSFGVSCPRGLLFQQI